MTVPDPLGHWLQPLITAATERGIDTLPILRACVTPSAGQPERFGVRAGAVDWIRVGRLLAEALGWTNYPPTPAGWN